MEQTIGKRGLRREEESSIQDSGEKSMNVGLEFIGSLSI
jgi:hypothetical protein